jgi:preprotein translocase subunit SecD
MVGQIDTITGLAGVFKGGAWVDYAMVIAFVVIALLLVSHFMDAGPKKWLALLGILIGGGLALRATSRRQRYLQKKLHKVNQAYKRVQEANAERNEAIEKNNGVIQDLENRMASLRPGVEADKEKLEVLEGEIAKTREDYERSLAASEAKSAVALEMAERETEKVPITSVADQIRAKYGLPSRTGVLPQPPVADPVPLRDKPKDTIVINGFTMKGDM